MLTLADLLKVFARLELVEPAHLDAALKPGMSATALLDELVRDGKLTAYQVGRLIEGKGEELSLGQYCLLEPLGRGGMGQVFRARHRLMNRIVAIKQIAPELTGKPEVMRRFRREIQALARLTHPNIIAAHDAERADNNYFLVMEYCKGTTLARLVEELGPLPIGQACDYIRQAALGLQHAHERGLVHRDVKPENLLVVDGVVKVLDLGLAQLRPVGEDGRDASVLTRSGVFMGTPDFIAPEQANEPERTDARSDIYALGCTLYYSLAGQPPFPGGTVLEKLLRHRSEKPMPIETLCPKVPLGLRDLVRRLMSKDPAGRPATAGEVAARLEPFVSLPRNPKQPVRAPSSGLQTTPEMPAATLMTSPARPTRRWSLAAGLGGLAFISVAAVLLYSWLPRQKTPSGDVPVTPLPSGRLAPIDPAGWRTWHTETTDSEVVSLAIDPTSRFLAAGMHPSMPGQSGGWFLFDIANKSRIRNGRHADNVSAVAFSSGPIPLLATCCGTNERVGLGEIQLAHAHTGESRGKLAGHKGGTLGLAFLPGSNRLVSVGRDKRIRIWDASRPDSPSEVDWDPGHQDQPICVAVSPNGKWIATGGDCDSSAKVWNWPERTLHSQEINHKSPLSAVFALDFGPRGETLAWTQGVGPRKQSAWIHAGVWNLNTDVKRCHDLRENCYCVRFAPDGKHLAVCQPSPPPLLLDCEGTQLRAVTWPAQVAQTVAFAPDGRWLATSWQDALSAERKITLWRHEKAGD